MSGFIFMSSLWNCLCPVSQLFVNQRMEKYQIKEYFFPTKEKKRNEFG